MTPASARNAMTVGAINKDWTYTAESNHGPMIGILAPGGDVLTISSAAAGTVRATGTSLAAPYVAGVALCLSALQNFRTPQELVDRIKELGTPGKVGGLPDSTVNLVAYNGVPAADDDTIVFPPGRKLPADGQQ